MRIDVTVESLTQERVGAFFSYLNDHISDNGKDNAPLFLPISKNDLTLPKSVGDSFRNGQSISLGQLGWRRVFIAIDEKNHIIGHIDLRSHTENYTSHRALMGMGVHRDYRKMGLGSMLIESVVTWAKNDTNIERIDLWVLSENSPAIKLYKKLGFQKIGTVEDMFRIDDASLNYIMMTRKIERTVADND
ncbi:MAG: GNAT family N-acetyltransferase [Bacteroidota bacterium]